MKVYNQNTPNDFGADCTLFSQFQIIKSMYWLDVKYSHINRVVDAAIKAAVLFSRGAVFETIYNWNVKRIGKIVWLNLKVLKKPILSKEFQLLTNDNYYWGVWLRNGNKKYLEVIKKGYLTKTDIDAIKAQGWGFNHNNVVWQDILDEVYIWERIELLYEILAYWVKQWVFGSLARTIVWADQFALDVWDLLAKQNADRDYNPYYKGMSDYEKKVMDKAAQLYYDYEIN